MKFSTLVLLSTFMGSNAFYQSHDIITHNDGSVHLFEKTQHRRLTTKNLKADSNGQGVTIFTVHGSEYITGKLHVDGIATVGGLKFENNDDVFGTEALSSLAGNGITVSGSKLTALELGATAGTALAGSTVTITSAQASAISANTAKTGITSAEAGQIVVNNDKTGITSAQASAISANTAKTGITSTQAGAISANTVKTSMTLGATAGTALEGDTVTITSAQASAISANTAKTGITSAEAGQIVVNNDKTGITSAQASAISANTAKTGITSGQASAIDANTVKTSMTLGATAGTALEGDTVTISTAQASAISANTAKTSMTLGTTSSTALAGDTDITVSAQKKEYRLERMILILCNTLGLKFEHLVRAVDVASASFVPYARFKLVEVNDNELYTGTSDQFVDVGTPSSEYCGDYSTYGNTNACPDDYSTRHALTMCATTTCGAPDFSATGSCCVPT